MTRTCVACGATFAVDGRRRRDVVAGRSAVLQRCGPCRTAQHERYLGWLVRELLEQEGVALDRETR